MEDTDIIAYLYPGVQAGGVELATDAIRHKQNEGRRVEPPRSPVASPDSQSHESGDRSERADTEISDGHDRLEYVQCLRISLSDVPKGKNGLEFGWNPKADIVLSKKPGVSFRHFSLTFNDQYCFIVKDLGSTSGTSVIYGTQDGGPRTNTEWIVVGDKKLSNIGPILIQVTKKLQFQIVVQPFDPKSATFRAKVDKFRAGSGTGGIDDLLDGVALRSSTQAPSTAPTVQDFHIKTKVGQGTFAAVYRMWNVRTGDLFAQKIPLDNLNQYQRRKWRNEALLLDRASHPHVIKLFGFDMEPTPSLRCEYIPGGSIRDHLKKQEYFSGIECRHILRQISSAVEHLHGLNPPIVHRDISDNNILIKRRDVDGIKVKLADMGSSKEGTVLHSIVGTPFYLPPELYGAIISRMSQTKEAYSKAVDIWELGMVIAQIAGGRPRYTEEHAANGTLWCEANRFRVQTRYNEQQDDLDGLLLHGMLQMNPSNRWDAQRCHQESLRLSEGSHDTWKIRAAAAAASTPGESSSGKAEEDTQGKSSEEGYEAETLRPHASDPEHVTAGVSDLVSINSRDQSSYEGEQSCSSGGGGHWRGGGPRPYQRPWKQLVSQF